MDHVSFDPIALPLAGRPNPLAGHRLTPLAEGAAYLVLNFLVSAYRRVAIPHVHVLHSERLPAGPKILAPNHDYMTDGFVLPAVIPGRLAFLVQAESFSLPIVGVLLGASGQIPVEPGRPGRCLRMAAEKLGRGWSVVIFPEGRLNHGGPIGRACTGAVRLSLRAGVPLVPVGFHAPGWCIHFFRGRYGGRWTRAGWQVRGPCAVAIGDPWKPFAQPRPHPSQTALRSAAEELRARIQTLSLEAKQEVERCASLW
jgi:1-acyl-sn-glycerol-3-phosphate acyltransferase